MVEGVASGDIDVIVSAHDPKDADVKRRPFAEAADGAIGLETLLSAALRLYHNGSVDLITLLQRADRESGAPARARERPAAKGAPADLVLIDLDTPYVVSPGAIALPLQEHALRRGKAGRPGAPDARCRTAGVQLR